MEHFNAKVLKPAVAEINNHKKYDIEIFTKKKEALQRLILLLSPIKNNQKAQLKY